MEKWKVWIPKKNMALPSYIKSVLSDDDGLTIICFDSEKKNKIIFKFDGFLYTYRNTSENCFLKTLDYLRENYESKFIHGTSLFEVENSKYLKWFKEESYDAWNVDEFKHYVIYTSDDILEVLSPYPPEIEVKDLVKNSK